MTQQHSSRHYQFFQLLRAPRSLLTPISDRTYLDLTGTLKISYFLNFPHPPSFFLSLICSSSFISFLSRWCSVFFFLNGAHFSLSLACSISAEVPGKSSSCGWGVPWPRPTVLSPALCSLMEPNNKAFAPDKQMGMNWQGARIPYNLISVYSAVSKEVLSQKSMISLAFPPNIYSLTYFYSHTVFPREEMSS